MLISISDKSIPHTPSRINEKSAWLSLLNIFLLISQKVENIRLQKDYTNLSEIPKIYTVAVISVEDHRFEKHHGIDVIASPKLAKQRQKQVIQKMIKYGNLSKEDANKILDKNI